MNDTSTPEGLRKELHKAIARYEKAGNKVAIVRMIGGSTESYGDHINGYDDGESQKDYRN